MTGRRQLANRALATIAAVLAALAAAPEARSQSLADGLRACLADHDSSRRLECYVRLARQATDLTASARGPAADAGGAGAGPSSPAAPPSPDARPLAAAPSPSSHSSAQSAAAGNSGIAEFGARNGPLSARTRAQAPRRIEAVVTRIGHRSYGQLIISLDNGQVWLQTEPVDYFPLKRGDAVVIRKAALGSFLLFAPFKRSTRVERIQ